MARAPRRKSVRYSPRIAAIICRRIANGESLNKMCGPRRRNGMPDRLSVYNWLHRYPNFKTVYVIEDGEAWEIGEGSWDGVAGVLARTLISSSTGALLSLSGGAEAFVSPRSEVLTAASRMRVGATGNIQVGSIPTSGGQTIPALFTVNGNPAPQVPNASATVTLGVYGPTSSACRIENTAFGGSAVFTGRRANGSPSAMSPLLANENVAVFQALGHGTTGFSGAERGSLRLITSANWTDSDQSLHMSFFTSAIGTAAPAERMRLTHDGKLGIAENSPDYMLDVNGPIGFNPGTSVTPMDNGDVVIEATSNTTLTFKLRGSDGTVRSGTITLS